MCVQRFRVTRRESEMSTNACVFASKNRSWLRLDVIVVASSLLALSSIGLPEGVVMVSSPSPPSALTPTTP